METQPKLCHSQTNGARKSYPSDLTDDQWKLVEPLIPPAKIGGRPRTVDMREVINGIFYVTRSGCAGRRRVTER